MQPESPFSIQPIDRLGNVTTSQEDFALEDTLGGKLRAKAEADFMGTSITAGRWKWIGVCVAVVFGLLLARSAQLQVVQGQSFFSLAEGNRIREEVLPSDRGRILDRSGDVLASNLPAFSLWVDRTQLENEDTYPQLVDVLSDLMDVSINDVHDLYLRDQSVGAEVLMTRDMPRDAALRVLSSPEYYPGIRVEAGVRRTYHTQNVGTLSALLGYTGVMSEEDYVQYKEQGYKQNELVGKTGIEQSYEQFLRGFPGEQRVEVDAIGNAQTVLAQREAVDGASLTLHIDADLQRFIERRLEEIEDRVGARNASVIVMDPRDGGVRALVSYPGYDGNAFAGSIDAETYRALIEDPARPLFSRAISGQFPSGSTFKPIVAAAALDANVINERTSFLSTGAIRIGQFVFPDWKAGGHGVTDVRKAIADSVNTFFYIIGGGYQEFDGLGLGPLMEAAAAFGLGSPLGIDIPNEAGGFLPSVAWKNEVKGEPWYIGDTYHVSIGQGDILVTPLQVAAFTAAFANGGVLYQPQVVDRYETQDRIQDVEPRVLNPQVASDRSVRIVQEGLRQTVTSGSARRLSTLSVPVTGKTGTAQWHSEKETHAWFTGYGPYADPELVVTVLVEQGGEGSAVAVPLAYDIFEWWFNRE